MKSGMLEGVFTVKGPERNERADEGERTPEQLFIGLELVKRLAREAIHEGDDDRQINVIEPLFVRESHQICVHGEGTHQEPGVVGYSY